VTTTISLRVYIWEEPRPPRFVSERWSRLPCIEKQNEPAAKRLAESVRCISLRNNDKQALSRGAGFRRIAHESLPGWSSSVGSSIGCLSSRPNPR